MLEAWGWPLDEGLAVEARAGLDAAREPEMLEGAWGFLEDRK